MSPATRSSLRRLPVRYREVLAGERRAALEALPSLLAPWRSFVAPRRSPGKQRRGPPRARAGSAGRAQLEQMPAYVGGGLGAVGGAQPLGYRVGLQLVLLRPGGLQRVHGGQVAQLGGPLQG